jgi:hypothetical protein
MVPVLSDEFYLRLSQVLRKQRTSFQWITLNRLDQLLGGGSGKSTAAASAAVTVIEPPTLRFRPQSQAKNASKRASTAGPERKEVLDLYALYYAVHVRGGIEQVCIELS